MLQQWMITVGILVAYIVALVIFALSPASAASVGWRLVLGLGAVPALIGLVLRSRMPESPRWLLRHGRYDEVRKAMATLGVEDVSDDDVRRAAEIVERVEGGSRESRRRAWTPGVRRALVVVCVFFIFQQITGINVPLYYGPHLLGPFFSGAHASLVDTTVAGVEVTLIMTAVNVAATYLGFRWIDKFGRKPLAIGGYTGMIVSALIAALGLAALSGTLRLVVIMIGLDFFIASFAVGVGGTGWTLQGEVFPTAVRGQAAAFCAMIDWLANFLSSRCSRSPRTRSAWPALWSSSPACARWPSCSCGSSCPRPRVCRSRTSSGSSSASRRPGRLAARVSPRPPPLTAHPDATAPDSAAPDPQHPDRQHAGPVSTRDRCPSQAGTGLVADLDFGYLVGSLYRAHTIACMSGVRRCRYRGRMLGRAAGAVE